MQYVWQPDRIGNELSFDCFCLDIHLLLITCQLLLLLTIINLLSCFHSLCNCTWLLQTFNFILVVVVGPWVWWWWQKIVNAALKAKAWTFEAKAKATGAKAKAIGPEAKAKTIKIGLEAPRGQGLASRTTSLADMTLKGHSSDCS